MEKLFCNNGPSEWRARERTDCQDGDDGEDDDVKRDDGEDDDINRVGVTVVNSCDDTDGERFRGWVRRWTIG